MRFLLREGARYACFGDGLCCTDIHAIGPVTRAEKRRLDVIAPGRVVRHGELREDVVVAHGGACVHRRGESCSIHAEHGALAKPGVCRRFPYRVVDTPEGRRIGTEHRCPCRTMGARPEIDPADVRASIAGGRADVVVPARIALAPRKNVSFATYRAIEAPLVARILQARRDDDIALEAEPFPALESATWIDVAHLYRSRLDGSACGDALAWFGDVLLAMQEGSRIRARQRPWSAAFDRAEARSEERDPEILLADWVADEIWGLEWTQRRTFLHARHDLATRLAVVREIARRLQSEGARADRAAAEAVMIGELAGAAPLWRTVVNAFILPAP